MAEEEKPETGDDDVKERFLLNPKVVANYDFLEGIGVFSFVEDLAREIHSYKTLLSKGLDIFNLTTIDEIMDATVRQISYHFLPSYIAFIWKPIQSHPDVTIRAYQDYKPFNMELQIDNITLFEPFFLKFPDPIKFDALVQEFGNDEALAPLKLVQPEIVIPILGPFGLYGIILIGCKTKKTAFTKNEFLFIQQLMCFVSQAIKNHLHYEHSLRDVKTGLYNHGFFMTRLKEEIAQMKRRDSVFSLIVMDVDKFKNFNDTYGHLAGDQVLEKLAQVIKQNVRNEDIPSRFGGEEFTVLLPRTEIDTAWVVAERLRTSIEAMHVPWEVPLPQVTISSGIYAFDGKGDYETSDILRRADEALYVSKAGGRNCSTIWEPGLIGAIPPKK